MEKPGFETDRREVYRYLGCKGNLPPQEVVEEVEFCIGQLEEEATPRCVYKAFSLEIEGSFEDEEVPLIKIPEAGMAFRSRNLAKNLRGCSRIYLMAVTLGPGPDRLIKRASITKMSHAVIYQAASAAMVEAWCDLVNRRIVDEAAEKGMFCRPRFSPGYGDFPLQTQPEVSAALNMPKTIGVSLMDSLLMTPSKSVTAVVGLSKTEVPCTIHGCEECRASASCAYRR